MGNSNSTNKESPSFIHSTAKTLLSSNTVCGNIFDTLDDEPSNSSRHTNDKDPTSGMILPGELCHSSKSVPHRGSFDESVFSIDESTGKRKVNATSALFARALISEVTDNPRTMLPVDMAAREKRLLKAQDRARRQRSGISALRGVSPMGGLNIRFTNNNNPPVGKDSETGSSQRAAVLPPNQLSENRAQLGSGTDFGHEGEVKRGKHTVTIGLSLSRRHSTLGHPDTVTRQTAFDFNELQDRDYKYVSSTDSSGWRAGGGEKGGNSSINSVSQTPLDDVDVEMNGHAPSSTAHKVAAPDTVHIPIIHIDAESPAAVDQIISSLARGEVFIPHMSILPEALSVNGVSPPDLVVRFGCERNDDLPPDEWPNWCLEFMHNQLYEYFHNAGARWTKRPFQITLAKKVRWRTVKHMNKFFAHSERVINAWREKGPQYLNPQLSYIEGGATAEEVGRPHGIYLLRNGRPTNYFAPNFEPPYTTKMTRSLLMNVISSSWDKKRRDWTSEPIPRMVTPAMLIATVCGCGDGGTTGFIASEDTIEQQQHNYVRDNLVRGGLGGAVMTDQRLKRQVPKQIKKVEQPVFRQKDGTKESDFGDNNFRQNTSTSSLNSRRSVNNSQQMESGKESTIDSESHFQNQTKKDTNNVQSEETDSFATSGSAEMKSNEFQIKKTRSGASAMSQGSSNSKGIHIQQRQPDAYMPSEGSSTFSRSINSPARKSQSSRSDSPNNYISDDYSADVFNEEADKISDQDNSFLSPINFKSLNINSPPGSEGGTAFSVGASATTIPISNQWSKSNDERTKDREIAKRIAKLEDSLKAFERADDFYDTEEDLPIVKTKTSKEKKKEKKEKLKREKREKKRKEKERLQEIEKNKGGSKTQSHQISVPQQMRTLKKNRSKDSANSAYSQRRTPTLGLLKSYSNHSLDYSMDSLTVNSNQLHNDGSMSVGTAGNQSLLSCVTRSTVHTQGSDDSYRKQKEKLEELLHEGDDDENDSLIHSVQSMEEVASDSDLFAIGWAKALDENSGIYYYFTLDRSKIVWENPLISEDLSSHNKQSPTRTFSSGA